MNPVHSRTGNVIELTVRLQHGRAHSQDPLSPGGGGVSGAGFVRNRAEPIFLNTISPATVWHLSFFYPVHEVHCARQHAIAVRRTYIPRAQVHHSPGHHAESPLTVFMQSTETGVAQERGRSWRDAHADRTEEEADVEAGNVVSLWAAVRHPGVRSEVTTRHAVNCAGSPMNQAEGRVTDARVWHHGGV